MAEITYDVKKTYAELDSWIAGLTPGTYNVEVDCTGVAADQFKGDWKGSHPSPFGIKLSKAKPNVFFNLKFDFPDNITDVSSCFENDGTEKVNCIKTINITSAKGVTNANYMFSGCTELTSIDTSAFTQVTNANYMFQYCTGLTSIDTSAFTQVTNANYMFQYCTGLTSIDTSAFTQVTDANGMFHGCTGLTSIDTSAFTQVTDASYMFNGCTSLSTLYATNSNVFDKGANLTASPIKIVYTNTATKEKIKSKLPSSGVIYYDLKEKLTYAVTSIDDNTEVNYNDKCILGNLKVGGNIEGNLTGNVNGKNVSNEFALMLDNINSLKSKMGFYQAEKLMYNPIISVPQFTFNGVTCKNVNFVFMGFAQDPLNAGKAIYMSADCLPGVKVSMDNLLKISGTIQSNKGIGECDIGKAAETSLDAEIFKITGKHLETYTREYDSAIHNEKVFVPLECEVHGKTIYSADTSTFSKYPQWESFKKSPDSKIKYIDFSSNKYNIWYWWNANKSSIRGRFCGDDGIGYSDMYYSNDNYTGVALAFCL